MKKEPVFTRDFILDMTVSMCCSLNYFTLLINIVGFATVTYGATSAEAGLAAGLYVVGGLISRFFFGKYIELIGRKRVLIASLALSVVMSAAYFYASSLLLLYIIRLLHGMTYGMASSCTADVAAKIIPSSRRGEGLSYFYLGVTMAMAIGPYLGMNLGASGDYQGVFSVGLVMYSIATVLAIFLHIPEEKLTEEQISRAKSFSLSDLVQRSAIPLGLTCMVFYFGYSGVLAFIMQYTQGTVMEEAGYYFYLAVAVGTLISRFTTGRIYDAHGANPVVLPGYVSFIIGMIMFASTDYVPLFMLSGFLMGYGISIIYAICQAIVVTSSPAHRYGVTSATFGSLSDMGSGFGPFILGTVLAATGYHQMYLICAGVSFCSLFMYWAIHGHREFREKHPEGC